MVHRSTIFKEIWKIGNSLLKKQQEKDSMKEVTGVKYKTSNGFFIVLDDLNDKLHVGDEIFFEGEKLIIKGIIAPTTPVAKWSIQV